MADIDTAGERIRRVLIVDDEESTRLLLERFLRSISGLQMTLAGNGEEALEFLSGRSFDLILLDLLMPGIGGIEALTRMRGSSANRDTPVIVVSMLADADTKVVCQSMGVVDYLVKPIQRHALISAVKGALA
jgi:two-component system response regulator AtoC